MKEIKPLLFKNYLALIKNSLGSRMWRNAYAQIGRVKKDILKNGKFSCAYFVSSILVICKLIKEIHVTVEGTLRDMENSGWFQIKKLKKGAILVWEELKGHKHLGFYFGNKKAISNNSHYKKTPVIHHYTFGLKNRKPKRKIIAIYWHKKLN